MRMLAGVLQPDVGTIHVGGVDVVAEPEHAKLQLSYMPQRFGLYDDLTVAENIYFYSELFRFQPQCAARAVESCSRLQRSCHSSVAWQDSFPAA